MSICRGCGNIVPQVEGHDGRKKVYCNEKCRYVWRKLQGTLTQSVRAPISIATGSTLPDLELLRSEFSYDPETGVVTRISTGLPAGSISSSTGYLVLYFKYRHLIIHRLAWYLYTGEDPKEKHIDHINRIKTDNRFSNLRLVTPAQNNLNKGESKAKGVYLNKKSGKYYAQISINGKNHHLGYFNTFEEAKAARVEAVKKCYTHSELYEE